MRFARYPKTLPILDVPVLSPHKLHKPSITLSKVDLPTDKWSQCGHSPYILTGYPVSLLPLPLGLYWLTLQEIGENHKYLIPIGSLNKK